MAKLNYLNVGCGTKFHKDWVNVDMDSKAPEVIQVNLIKGIPFPDNTFEVVYHSQVLEHIPKENAPFFIEECYRVLKPGGILRVVLPDLENIAKEYLKYLQQNIDNPTEESEANYDWMLLEMYDQTVRNVPGGHMAEFFKTPKMVNEKFVIDRIGRVGRDIREAYLSGKSDRSNLSKAFSSPTMFKKALRFGLIKVAKMLGLYSKATEVGSFRLGGEIHMWMYDRYSLGKLLLQCGFSSATVKSPSTSDIPNWDSYELDIREGNAVDPTSLFMEAKK